jgi:hypothetical protein
VISRSRQEFDILCECVFIPARIKFQRIFFFSLLVYFGKLILLSSENLRGKKENEKISSKKDGGSMGSYYACYSSNFSARVRDKHSIIFQDYKSIGNTKRDFLVLYWY